MLDQPDQLVLRVPQEQPDLQDPQARRVTLDQPDRKAFRVSKVFRVKLVLLAQLEQPAPQAQQAQQVILDLQAPQAQQVRVDLRAQQDQRLTQVLVLQYPLARHGVHR